MSACCPPIGTRAHAEGRSVVPDQFVSSSPGRTTPATQSWHYRSVLRLASNVDERPFPLVPPRHTGGRGMSGRSSLSGEGRDRRLGEGDSCPEGVGR
jgi:hypothetical protein